MKTNSTTFHSVANEMADLVVEKNAAYGDSFNVSGEFIKLLWPNGIPKKSYTDMLAIIRIFDKMKRIATDKDALGESPWKDILGYAILVCQREARSKENVDVG